MRSASSVCNGTATHCHGRARSMPRGCHGIAMAVARQGNAVATELPYQHGSAMALQCNVIATPCHYHAAAMIVPCHVQANPCTSQCNFGIGWPLGGSGSEKGSPTRSGNDVPTRQTSLLTDQMCRMLNPADSESSMLDPRPWTLDPGSRIWNSGSRI